MFKIPRLCQVISINRQLHVTKILQNKNVQRQVKILRKLLGNRETGSKKRWYPSESSPQDSSAISLSKTNKQGKNSTRRVTILNKLFMKHITDLLATGQVSDEIIGKGLEISRVKVTTDFQGVNVFWFGKDDSNDIEIEKTLSKCAGAIRHELSQLRLMGEVPRIYFVKDKTLIKSSEVEHILKNCDFGEDYHQHDPVNQLKNELNLSTTNSPDESWEDESLPEMRHDVLGLNHKEIMNKILTKLKKSKQAWETYENESNEISFEKENTLANVQSKLDELDINDDKFSKFLRSQRYGKKISDRKKNIGFHYSQADDHNEDDYVDTKDDDYIEELENEKR